MLRKILIYTITVTLLGQNTVFAATLEATDSTAVDDSSENSTPRRRAVNAERARDSEDDEGVRTARNDDDEDCGPSKASSKSGGLFSKDNMKILGLVAGGLLAAYVMYNWGYSKGQLAAQQNIPINGQNPVSPYTTPQRPTSPFSTVNSTPATPKVAAAAVDTKVAAVAPKSAAAVTKVEAIRKLASLDMSAAKPVAAKAVYKPATLITPRAAVPAVRAFRR